MPEATKTLIRVDNLKKHFPIRGGFLSRLVGQVKAGKSAMSVARKFFMENRWI